MESNKFLDVFKSRKFWASLIGILVSLGVWTFGEAETDKFLEVIGLIVGGYTIGTGIEASQKKQNG